LPSNKKEGIIFGVFMCSGMVLVMSLYNMILHGAHLTFGAVVLQLVGTFIIAFLVESFVEPIARKLALSLPYDQSIEKNFIIALGFCMVPIMVLIMSIYGMILTSLMVGLEGSLITAYLKTVGLNLIVALPAQLLLVGPISRMLLAKYIKPQTQRAEEMI
jgi:hypothetical protein